MLLKPGADIASFSVSPLCIIFQLRIIITGEYGWVARIIESRCRGCSTAGALSRVSERLCLGIPRHSG